MLQHHTFETDPSNSNARGYSFHENISEGEEIFFLAQFPESTIASQQEAENIFGRLVDSLQTKSNLEGYSRFEEALKNTNTAMRDLYQKASQKPSIIVAFYDFHHLFLSQSGNAEAAMIREENISQITEGGEPETSAFVNILSGEVEPGDTVILGTGDFFNACGSIRLVDTFRSPDYQKRLDAFQDLINQNIDQNRLFTIINNNPKKNNNHKISFLSQSKVANDPILNKDNTTKSRQKGTKLHHQIEAHISNTARKIKHFWYTNKNGKIIIASGIIFVFIFMMLWRFVGGYESEAIKDARKKIDTAQQNLKSAESQILQGDVSEARKYLNDSKQSVQSILSSGSKYFRSDANLIMASIEEKFLQIENARKVTPDLVADISLKNENFEALGLVELRSNFYVYNQKDIVKTIRNSVNRSVPLSNRENIVDAAVRSRQNTLLFLTDAPRVIEYKEGIISPMRTKDETWKSGIEIDIFGSRFVYILDPVGNQIWKYERRQGSYSVSTPYNDLADLSLAVSFTIDGSIYILSENGTIQKIHGSKKQPYKFSNIPSVPFSGKNLKIYTTDELEFLYILDPNNARILIFSKGKSVAQYRKQVIYDEPGAIDFYIDSSGRSANIITKDKIYELSL